MPFSYQYTSRDKEDNQDLSIFLLRCYSCTKDNTPIQEPPSDQKARWTTTCLSTHHFSLIEAAHPLGTTLTKSNPTCTSQKQVLILSAYSNPNDLSSEALPPEPPWLCNCKKKSNQKQRKTFDSGKVIRLIPLDDEEPLPEAPETLTTSDPFSISTDW